MITGLRPETFMNLQLNAGVFLKNFDYSKYTDASALETAILAALEAGTNILGATQGGGTFQCTPTIRQIAVDGLRYPVVGSTVNDMWTVKLTGVMKEVTPENFKDVLLSADIEGTGNVRKIKVRTDVLPKDYINSLCWVGDTSDQGFVLINLNNVINLNGANFTFTDKGEGTLPFEFQAHHKELADMEYAPCEIVFFDKAA